MVIFKTPEQKCLNVIRIKAMKMFPCEKEARHAIWKYLFLNEQLELEKISLMIKLPLMDSLLLFDVLYDLSKKGVSEESLALIGDTVTCLNELKDLVIKIQEKEKEEIDENLIKTSLVNEMCQKDVLTDVEFRTIFLPEFLKTLDFNEELLSSLVVITENLCEISSSAKDFDLEKVRDATFEEKQYLEEKFQEVEGIKELQFKWFLEALLKALL